MACYLMLIMIMIKHLVTTRTGSIHPLCLVIVKFVIYSNICPGDAYTVGLFIMQGVLMITLRIMRRSTALNSLSDVEERHPKGHIKRSEVQDETYVEVQM